MVGIRKKDRHTRDIGAGTGIDMFVHVVSILREFGYFVMKTIDRKIRKSHCKANRLR